MLLTKKIDQVLGKILFKDLKTTKRYNFIIIERVRTLFFFAEKLQLDTFVLT